MKLVEFVVIARAWLNWDCDGIGMAGEGTGYEVLFGGHEW
jgi:hypothetical protein